jgi:hypothetical protein
MEVDDLMLRNYVAGRVFSDDQFPEMLIGWIVDIQDRGVRNVV